MNMRSHGNSRSRSYSGAVRAARAYLAGVGSTGSLLAGAALMFIVASALVAFHGWPHIAAQPSPGEVVISPRSESSPATQVARRLAVVAATPAAGAAASAGVGALGSASSPAHPPTAAGRALGGGRSGIPGPPRQTVGAPTGPATPVAAPASGPGAPTSCCVTRPPPRSPVQQVQQTRGQATTTLGNVASGTGSQLGSTVQQTTNAVAGAVGGVSPAAGGVVGSAGSGAAQTVTGATEALGGVASGPSGH